ncbi:MAG: hypothetical protein PHV82_06255, partial [Victivallaceae bacterium]|nr:hypothetical protein [Victivallaceae bacterium]
LLEKFEPTSVLSKKNKLFWLQFRIPGNQYPGTYNGNITISFKSGKEAILPVSLRVLPFKLEQTKAVWAVYPYTYVWDKRNYSYAQRLQYFKDMKDYGITGLIERKLPAFSIKDGKIEKFTFQCAEFLKLKKEAGLTGPWLNGVQQLIETATIKMLLGSRPDANKYPFPENNNKQVQEIFVSVLKKMDKMIKSIGGEKYGDWYYQCIDEAHQGSKMQQALWELSLARKAGVKTCATVYPINAVEKLGKYLDISINSFIPKNKALFDAYMKIAKKYNLTYWYLGGGCYTGQEGGLMPDRYRAGFLFYKTGLPCHVSWQYQWARGNPYNDFDIKDYCITYPCRNPKSQEVSISTLQWEGVREGITDYKYADTLKNYIARAKEKGYIEDAGQSQKVLDSCMNYVPWGDDYKAGNCYLLPGNFTNDKAEKLRWMLANEIIRLKKIMNK